MGVGSPTIYFLAAGPWLVESLWLWLWVPTRARRLRKQRDLDAVFGPGYFDMSQPQSELYWLMAFVLYHLPLMLVGLAVPNRLRVRYPWLVSGVAMLATPVLYSAVIFWLAGRQVGPLAASE